MSESENKSFTSNAPPNQMDLAPFFASEEVIRLTKNGIWMSDDTVIDHQGTVRLFAKSIHLSSSGQYEIRVGRESHPIIVEDTPYFVTGLENGSGHDLIKLSDGSIEVLDFQTLQYQEQRLTCLVKSGKFYAKFLRQPYYELLKCAEQDIDGYYFYRPGSRSGEKIRLRQTD
jgi:hypothetical protein